MASGIGILDFGAFPGQSDASIAVTGQTTIVNSSIVGASLRLVNTVDHSADEHRIETIAVFAGNIVAGTGFTIFARNTSQQNEPVISRGGKGTRIYGQWTVAWAWI